MLFFSIIACSVLMALVFYYNDMLEKVTMQRTQQSSGFVCYQRTQLNATHAQLLEKLRPIALAETCRFLRIQSSELISQNARIHTSVINLDSLCRQLPWLTTMRTPALTPSGKPSRRHMSRQPPMSWATDGKRTRNG